MPWPSGLDTLRDRDFAWYDAARVISLTGSTLVSVPLVFAVLHIGGTATALAQVIVARTLAMVLFVLFGGVVSDRFDRVTVLRVAHLLTAATQGLAAYLIISGHAQIWSIALIEALNGVASAFTMPAMQGIVPSLVPRERLQSANALLGFSRNTLSVIGPVVGGMLVVGVGSGWALAVDAVSYLVALWCLGRIRLAARMPAAVPTETPDAPAGVPTAAPPDAPAPTGLVAELREGWDEFVARTWVWVIVAVFLVLNAIGTGAWMIVAPIVAKAEIGEQGWGLTLGAEAVGLVLATIVLAQVRLRRPLVAGMVWVAATAVPMVLLGMSTQLWVILLGAALAGVGMDVFNIAWTTALQEHIPERVLSRVSSYDMLGSFIAMPLGQAAYGILGDLVDRHALLIWTGVAYAVLSVATLASRSVRSLRSIPPELSPASSGTPQPTG